MAEKWNKKTIAKMAEELRSPFDKVGPNGQRSGLDAAVERIKQMIGKKKVE